MEYYDDTIGIIDDRVSQLADSIIAGEVSTKDTSTLTYYGRLLIQAMDRLDREAQIRRDQFVAQQRITKKQDRLKLALSTLSELIQDREGMGSIYFSDLTDVKLISNSPITRGLEKYRIKGYSLDRAIKSIAKDTGRAEKLIITYVKDNELDKNYPIIDEDSVDYKLGQEHAASLGTSFAKYRNTVDDMYNQQMRYICNGSDLDKIDLGSYMGGFNNIANKYYDSKFIKSAKEKSKIILRSLV